MEKVKVPQEYADYLEELDNRGVHLEEKLYLVARVGWGYGASYGVNGRSDTLPTITAYITNNNMEDAIRAILDGYEVIEKEFYLKLDLPVLANRDSDKYDDEYLNYYKSEHEELFFIDDKHQLKNHKVIFTEKDIEELEIDETGFTRVYLD